MREKYPECSIFWVPSTNIESVQQAYQEICRELRIASSKDEQVDVKSLVQRHLSQESAGRWLLIFDNADDLEMWIHKDAGTAESPCLIDYLPRSSRGSIIFTTRSRKTALQLPQQSVIEVAELDEEAATQVLSKSLICQEVLNDHQTMLELLKQLTFLPLAIVQAAAYINKNRIPLTEYLSLLEDTEGNVIELLSEEFEDEGRYRDIKNPVATTWLISFEQIQKHDPLAAEYLSFMSCLDPKNIPQSLLPPAQSRKKVVDAIGTLSAYSFVTRRTGDQSLDLHRLVHLATRNWLRKEDSFAKWTGKALARLDDVFPTSNYRNRRVWRAYLPHAHYVLETDIVHDEPKRRLQLLKKYGQCLLSDGRYDEAEKPFLEVMETSSRVLGAEHPSTLTSIANLASTFWNQGRWKEAEELEVQVTETKKRVLGAEHPSTLTSMADLASTYRNQGRWKEAEELEVQVIETSSRVLGAEHPSTLTSMANLASTYRNQGRWKEAQELRVKELEICSRVLGTEHPDTLTSMANLASTYGNQGRWKEAEELEVQVVETRKRALGAEHPSTLISMANLALTFWNQGRWKEAEELEVQVTETKKRVLGAEHPSTLTSMANLASTYRNQGRWKEAEELEVQVIETRKRVLGAEHPSTLTSMANLAFTFKFQGRNGEAILLLKTCLQLRKQILGPQHPNTASSLQALNEWQIEDMVMGP